MIIIYGVIKSPDCADIVKDTSGSCWLLLAAKTYSKPLRLLPGTWQSLRGSESLYALHHNQAQGIFPLLET